MKNTPHRFFTFTVPTHAPHFDNPALRWSTFVGEFLAPIVRDRAVESFMFLNHEMADYELRFAANDYSIVETRLHGLAQRMGIQIKGKPTAGETIGGCFGDYRFIAQNKLADADAVARRSVLVFQAMHSACELFLDNLTPQGSYWQIEPNGQKQHNPLGNMFESMLHLYANMSRAKFDIIIVPSPAPGSQAFTRAMAPAVTLASVTFQTPPVAAPTQSAGGVAVCHL